MDEGAAYTALETAPGYEDVVLKKDDYGDDIKLYEEIVNYDPATLERTVLITTDSSEVWLWVDGGPHQGWKGHFITGVIVKGQSTPDYVQSCPISAVNWPDTKFS